MELSTPVRFRKIQGFWFSSVFFKPWFQFGLYSNLLQQYTKTQRLTASQRNNNNVRDFQAEFCVDINNKPVLSLRFV